MVSNRGNWGRLSMSQEALGAHGPHEDHGEAQAVIGTRTPLLTQGVAPNILVVDGAQLVSARVPYPRQWVVTFMQAVTGKNGVQPWLSPIDGSTTAPTGANNSAPIVPAAASGDGVVQVTLRWGAGGVAFESRFDYPMAGGKLGITADAVDVNVGLRDPAVTVYASADLVPIVGAFMVEGVATDPMPVHWTERQADLVHGTTRYWSVKPYARRVRVALNPLNASDVYRIAFTDASGFIFWAEFVTAPNATAGISVVVDVPGLAEYLAISNASAANDTLCFVAWDIGLT